MPENDLFCLKTPADYLSAAPHVFPSPAALSWFVRRHRQRLIAAGALVSVNRRILLDVPRFNAAVLEIGRALAEAA